MGLHHLRRLPGGLPGVHRPPAQDPADAPAHRAQRRVRPHARRGRQVPRQHEQRREPLANESERPHGLGRGPRREDSRGAAGRRIPAVHRLRRRVRRQRQEDLARAGQGAQRGERQVRGARQAREVQRRPGPPPRRRDGLPDHGAGECRHVQRGQGHQGDRLVPALLPYDQERIPAVRRQLRGHPPQPAHQPPAQQRQAQGRDPEREAVHLPRQLLHRPLERHL